MVSPIDICNNAIIRLGGNSITSLDENTIEAISCNQQYDFIRRDLLRNHPWNFAIKRTSLAQDLTPPEFTYDFAYTLPSDCLRVIATKEQENDFLYGFTGDFNGFLTINNRVNYVPIDRYKIEGRKFLSNNNVAEIIYVQDVTDTSIMSSDFVELLAVRIAYVCCYRITGSIQVRADLERELQVLLSNARSNNGQEGTRERIEVSSWLASRGW